MMAWYARLLDFASRIIRKDGSIITPDNYDIVVNTQFWTKMANGHMKNAVRYKFDVMASHSQFVVGARKVESEFATRTAKVLQQYAEPHPLFKQSLDSILERLSALESRQINQFSLHAMRISQSHVQCKSSNIHCWNCNQTEHVKSNCPLNSNWLETGNSPIC